jgi:Putative zinc-finger
MKLSLFHSCQQTHALIYAGEDRELGLLERGALHSHLWMCKNCTSAKSNVALLREQLQRWRQNDGA